MTAQWLTTAQAADYVGVHPTTLREWARRGFIPCTWTIGGHRRFSQSVFDEHLEGQRETVRTPGNRPATGS